MRWKESGSAYKSSLEATRLVHEVLQAPDFSIHDLTNFDTSRETCQMEAAQKEIPPDDLFGIDKWRCTSVNISVPTREKNKEGNGRIFTIDRFRYRPILDVIRAVFAEASSKSFHLTPFKKLWKSPVTGHEQRVYDELYTSNVWNQAQDKIMKQKRHDGCKLEKVVAGLMFWSDSTHLAQFSHTSAWPIYLFFGNLSKYAQASPQSGCCHPIAFIPSVRWIIMLHLHCLITRLSFQSPSRSSYRPSLKRKTTATFSHIANENSFKQSGRFYSIMTSSMLTRMAVS